MNEPRLFTLYDLCSYAASMYATGYAEGWHDGDQERRTRQWWDVSVRPQFAPGVDVRPFAQREAIRLAAADQAKARHDMAARPWPQEQEEAS